MWMCIKLVSVHFPHFSFRSIFTPFWREPIKGCGGFERVSSVHCVSSVHHIHIYFGPQLYCLVTYTPSQLPRSRGRVVYLGLPRSPLSGPRILKGGKGRVLGVCLPQAASDNTKQQWPIKFSGCCSAQLKEMANPWQTIVPFPASLDY